MCKIRDDEVNSTVYIQNPQWEPHYIAGYFRFTGEVIIRESTLCLEGKCRRGFAGERNRGSSLIEAQE